MSEIERELRLSQPSVMGERLSQGIAAIALLANSFATGRGLFVLVLVFAPISGAHLNPLVTLLSATERAIRAPVALMVIVAQVMGQSSGSPSRTRC